MSQTDETDPLTRAYPHAVGQIRRAIRLEKEENPGCRKARSMIALLERAAVQHEIGKSADAEETLKKALAETVGSNRLIREK